ncbi:MAG: hypothetical protein LQ351_003520 [Letrouitia transgressa]|nr:MAG: hypothetical protein LQ351_003520 [Letrouitia transgressa]
MVFFTSPNTFRHAQALPPSLNLQLSSSGLSPPHSSASIMQGPLAMLKHQPAPPHSSHPAFPHLLLLVFEAVLEVVCVSAPGYIVARQGMFDAEMQKFAANLNVMLFTPCLIFTKLASQLTLDKLAELAIIPVIFAVQTLVSFLCAILVSKVFRFKKRARNFVIAMGVFGNSNSLPISLVLSLSQTIKGLHWNKIQGDNDDEVGARGILYLLIFQQLGQLLRWSWGYHVLLAPPDITEGEIEQTNSQLESGQQPYLDFPPDEQQQPLLNGRPVTEDQEDQRTIMVSGPVKQDDRTHDLHGHESRSNVSGSEDGEQTPITHQQYTSSISSRNSSIGGSLNSKPPSALNQPTNMENGLNPGFRANGGLLSTKSTSPKSVEESNGLWGRLACCQSMVKRVAQSVLQSFFKACRSLFNKLPFRVQNFMRSVGNRLKRFFHGVWAFMNPPLWAMLVAILVASIPSLQRLFFSDGTFIKNSVTNAIQQSGGVAVPLILVVLGANLAGNTLPTDSRHNPDDKKEERRLLFASLISRMLLPTVIMAPLLAITAKYAPVSIIDDPIFIVVCFLLTGAPSALQLAQICQINEVYVGAISKLFFHSYVLWILPSTLILVVLAIESLEWAAA